MDDEPTPPRSKPVLRELAETALLAALFFFAVRAIAVPFEVEGASMDPSLHNGERLFVNRTAYFHFDANTLLNILPGSDAAEPHVVYPFDRPERGDIVVFNPPLGSAQPYIKRIVGLPGERISFQAGHVYVDGQRLDEPYIAGPITFCGNSPFCQVGPIPDGYVFVLGDNRQNSADSRSFGLVSVDRIIGQAFFTNWPPADIGLVPHADYPQAPEA